jgi:hypothetical protein
VSINLQRAKLIEYLDAAIQFDQLGEQKKKARMLQMASQYFEEVRKQSPDLEFLAAVNERIEIFRNMRAIDQFSDLKFLGNNKNFPNKIENDRRRSTRYITPILYVKFAKDRIIYKTMNYSLTGIRVENVPDYFSVGTNELITISLATTKNAPAFSGFGTAARALSNKSGIGIRFLNSVENPITKLVNEKLINLYLAQVEKEKIIR